MTVSTLPRKFRLKFSAQELLLDDPNPALSPAEVKSHLVALYPELVAGEIIGPEIKNDTAEYTISGTKIGVKG